MHASPAPVDLRSDTVTKPTDAMRQAMAGAEVGDDVLGDDPTVRRLELRVAMLLGKQDAIFVPSGTMANQIALALHTRRGDEIIAHEGSHIFQYEGAGPAVIAGCMIRGLPGPRGHLTPAQIRGAVRADNPHFPRSSLLVLENTHNKGGGAVWTLHDLRACTEAARADGLRTHLDGARLWNACAAAGYPPDACAALFDTVSCCFSKGLGAPVGSALAGTTQDMHQARRLRKMLGGGMRQSGLLAAAALHALDHHMGRLAEDHANAGLLGSMIAGIHGLELDPQHLANSVGPGAAAGQAGGRTIESNIVLFRLSDAAIGVGLDAKTLCTRLRERGVLMLPTGPVSLRAVTNLMVDAAGVSRAADALRDLLGHALAT